MTKKTKATARDWRTGKGYPEHGERTDLWAWEFLRRNPDYRADWLRFVAAADSLRADYGKPCTGLPGEWEGQEKNPYWLVGHAFGGHDERATVFEPARNDGESESAWIRRIHQAGGRCNMRPLNRALGSRWGLDSIADPAIEKLGIGTQWELSPSVVRQPAVHGRNQEYSWVRVLEEVAKILRPDPLLPESLEKARALLASIPVAWEKRQGQIREENDTERRGRSIIEVDLRISIPEQLKQAGAWLEHSQATWRTKGGTVWSDGRRNKQTPGYAIYLRGLDAIEEIGETNKEQWRKEIAAAMVEGYKATAVYTARKKHLDKASTWVERAKQLRDGEYRRLVAMAVKPTFAEFEKARQRTK